MCWPRRAIASHCYRIAQTRGLLCIGVQDAPIRDLYGDVVILATGGFGRSEQLLSKYVPSIKHLPSTNGQWAQGEGVVMAEQIGASLIHMDQVCTQPYVVQLRPRIGQ
jgi:succinate dehydrogenase/fumarate reductase flavoprotein subunit